MAKFKTGKKLVEETHNLWRDYSNKRETWAKHAVEDKEFRLGRQWTTEQRRVLQERPRIKPDYSFGNRLL